MVEYNNNQANPNNNMATILFVLLALVIVVIGAIYLFPRLSQNAANTTPSGGNTTHIQVDTPPSDTGSGTGTSTGSGDTTPSGGTTPNP